MHFTVHYVFNSLYIFSQITAHWMLIEWRKGLIKCSGVIFVLISSPHLSCVFVYMRSINRWLWFFFLSMWGHSKHSDTQAALIYSLHTPSSTHTLCVINISVSHAVFCKWNKGLAEKGLIPVALGHFPFSVDHIIIYIFKLKLSFWIIWRQGHFWSVLMLWKHYREHCTLITVLNPRSYSPIKINAFLKYFRIKM